MVVQVVLHEAGLHAGPQLLGVHLEDAVHVARAIEHERVVDGLAGERGPAAARQDRDAELARHLDRRLDIVGVAGNDDADRLDLVHGGVGRVEEAGSLIEADISADSPAERALEVVHARHYTRWSGDAAYGYYSGVAARLLAFSLVLLLAPLFRADAAPAAPGFKVKLLDGATSVDSHDVIGKKILVLRFQASYCKPCAKESPGLSRIFDRYGPRDVEVLAVHVQDTATDTKAFVRKYKVTYPIALDPKLTIGNSFGFKGTPYTVVIDLKGEMVTRLHGAIGGRQAAAHPRRALEEGSDALVSQGLSITLIAWSSFRSKIA